MILTLISLLFLMLFAALVVYGMRWGGIPQPIIVIVILIFALAALLFIMQRFGVLDLVDGRTSNHAQETAYVRSDEEFCCGDRIDYVRRVRVTGTNRGSLPRREVRYSSPPRRSRPRESQSYLFGTAQV